MVPMSHVQRRPSFRHAMPCPHVARVVIFIFLLLVYLRTGVVAVFCVARASKALPTGLARCVVAKRSSFLTVGMARSCASLSVPCTRWAADDTGALDVHVPKISVVGVGGAGGNAINNMIESGLEGMLCHSCGQPADVEPDSFFWGTSRCAARSWHV